MTDPYDYIVVGSGACGAMAAETLANSGARVGILDVGEKDNEYDALMPNLDFLTLRLNDENQHLYLLGKDYEGIPWQSSRVGSQLTPPRGFLTRLTDSLISFDSKSLKPMESLARGGLGAGWGLGCYLFSKGELETIGLDEAEMLPAYEIIAKRIGISGSRDDATPYTLRNLEAVQPPTNLDNSMRCLYASYIRNRSRLNRNGVVMGRLGLAVLTEDRPGRKQAQYNDMDFWNDKDKSAYRSWMTIDELEKRSNVAYHSHCLVTKFKEDSYGVEVHVLSTDHLQSKVFRAKRLLLAPGVLGTARIVIRSLNYQQERMPFITNPYCYVPCLQWRMLGTPLQQRKGSFGQLVVFVDEEKRNIDSALAALFSYRSLLLFKLLREVPLNFADGRQVLQSLQSAFVIAGVHHPERGSPEKFIRLEQTSKTPTGDRLTGQYILSDDEIRANVVRERKIRSALRTMGCLPLRTIYTAHGGSIHYAGTLPFNESGKPFTVNRKGRLAGTRNVYVADGSGFRYLPAKGLTLTLMANAHNVAMHAIKDD